MRIQSTSMATTERKPAMTPLTRIISSGNRRTSLVTRVTRKTRSTRSTEVPPPSLLNTDESTKRYSAGCNHVSQTMLAVRRKSKTNQGVRNAVHPLRYACQRTKISKLKKAQKRLLMTWKTGRALLRTSAELKSVSTQIQSTFATITVKVKTWNNQLRTSAWQGPQLLKSSSSSPLPPLSRTVLKRSRNFISSCKALRRFLEPTNKSRKRGAAWW
mmetsp:Transcript_47076/g.108786  ORF Transcript_47076/g.108786 Transcript_47076/m.108786 type:complete len:215 (+) Transcript_47076:718-1362(+)